MAMTASCLLPNTMACCVPNDVAKSHDVIPMPDALRDATFITLSSHCQHLIMPPPVASSPLPPPPCPSTASATQGVSSPRHGSLSREVSSAGRSLCPTPVLYTCAGEPLHLLDVSSGDLRYRGEGAEHIVLRVISSGQVLRLRKTAVGSQNSAQDLVIRAYKDEEFLCNVARPILGPLLTDESQLVQIDAKTVRELKDSVEPKREIHRRHKEINSEGIACICPDAASIFISRSDVLSSSSSPTLPGASSLSYLSNFHIKAVSVPPSAIVPTAVSTEQNESERRDSHIRTESKSLVSQETQCGLNLRSSLPLSTISLSPSVITNSRQDAIPLDFFTSFSMQSPLSTSLPLASVKPQNICIEIKPKQGFIDTSTPDLPLCRYCIKQYIKVGKNGDHSTTSNYCPIDLFSGESTRMRRAMEGLMESPQNNLKVFVDGEPVEDCRSFRYLRDVIIAALTYDFCSTKQELPADGCLSPQSPLGRTLAFQKLDHLGVYEAASLYADLVTRIGKSKTVDELLQDLRCWTGVSQFCQSDSDLCSRCLHDDIQNVNGSLKNHYQYALNHISLNAKRIISDIRDTSAKSFNQETVIRKLQAYLLSTTAKDLSLMILLTGPHRSTPPSNVPNSSPFIIEVESGVWFRCQVTGVDLVAKPPSKILKHKQDYEQLKAVLEELKIQGKEPQCCRQ